MKAATLLEFSDHNHKKTPTVYMMRLTNEASPESAEVGLEAMVSLAKEWKKFNPQSTVIVLHDRECAVNYPDSSVELLHISTVVTKDTAGNNAFERFYKSQNVHCKADLARMILIPYHKRYCDTASPLMFYADLSAIPQSLDRALEMHEEDLSSLGVVMACPEVQHLTELERVTFDTNPTIISARELAEDLRSQVQAIRNTLSDAAAIESLNRQEQALIAQHIQPVNTSVKYCGFENGAMLADTSNPVMTRCLQNWLDNIEYDDSDSQSVYDCLGYLFLQLNDLLGINTGSGLEYRQRIIAMRANTAIKHAYFRDLEGNVVERPENAVEILTSVSEDMPPSLNTYLYVLSHCNGFNAHVPVMEGMLSRLSRFSYITASENHSL